MKHCRCEEEGDSGSSFIFGLILGCIVGAIVAIVLYKKSKGKILDQLKEKIEDFIKPETPTATPQKVDVELPPQVLLPTSVKSIPKSKAKLFKKPKK